MNIQFYLQMPVGKISLDFKNLSDIKKITILVQIQLMYLKIYNVY